MRGRAVVYGGALVLFVVAATGLQVSMRRVLSMMPAYQWFVFQSGTLGYLPLSFLAMVIQGQCSSKKEAFTGTAALLRKSVVMAFCDGLANFCVIVGSTHSSMAFQTLMPQAVIPMTMLGSYVYLNATFNPWQIAGAALILAGSFIVVVPALASNSDLLFLGVLAFSNVPMTVSALYKEAVLHEDAGVFALSTYITFFQVLWGFAFIPLNALPGLGGVPLSAIPEQITDGTRCLAGELGGGCTNVWWSWISFVLCVLVMNLLMLVVMKLGSAAASYVAMGVVLPLANILTSIPAVMAGAGPVTPLDPYTCVSCGCCFVGLVLFSRETASTEEEKEEPLWAEPMTPKDFGTRCLGFSLTTSFAPPRKVARRDVRMAYVSRLGISPLASPAFRERLARLEESRRGGTRTLARGLVPPGELP